MIKKLCTDVQENHKVVPIVIVLLLDGVKVTFFNAKWEFLKPAKVERFNLASIETIAAMKINILFLRAKYRDYYDLYCLAKAKMALREMFEKAKLTIEAVGYKPCYRTRTKKYILWE